MNVYFSPTLSFSSSIHPSKDNLLIFLSCCSLSRSLSITLCYLSLVFSVTTNQNQTTIWTSLSRSLAFLLLLVSCAVHVVDDDDEMMTVGTYPCCVRIKRQLELFVFLLAVENLARKKNERKRTFRKRKK